MPQTTTADKLVQAVSDLMTALKNTSNDTTIIEALKRPMEIFHKQAAMYVEQDEEPPILIRDKQPRAREEVQSDEAMPRVEETPPWKIVVSSTAPTLANWKGSQSHYISQDEEDAPAFNTQQS